MVQAQHQRSRVSFCKASALMSPRNVENELRECASSMFEIFSQAPVGLLAYNDVGSTLAELS